MVSTLITVTNPAGFHVAPASNLCNLAMEFQSKVTFTTGNITANAKSMLSVLAAKVKNGTEINLICEGEDEEEALRTISEAIRNGLRSST